MRVVLDFVDKRKIVMAIDVQKKVRSATQITHTKKPNVTKTKYVVYKKGKKVCLAEKGLTSKAFNDDAIRMIEVGDTVSILRNGMSRVQLARISRALNNSGAKVKIVNI